jgi:hypothetical protein
VNEHRGVKRPEHRLRRRVEQRTGAGKVQHREQALRREESIGDHPDEERRNHRGQRGRPVRQADLLAGKSKRSQPGPHRHVPRAPDEVLEEHHHRQLQTNGCGHAGDSKL